MGERLYRECPTCGGSGRNGWACSGCDGRGVIPACDGVHVWVTAAIKSLYGAREWSFPVASLRTHSRATVLRPEAVYCRFCGATPEAPGGG